MMTEANYKASGESLWIVFSFFEKVQMYEHENTAQS